MADNLLPSSSVRRVFEQGPEAISFYSDYVQVTATSNEVLLQFYETIPRPPEADGNIREAKSHLRATAILSFAHAEKLMQLLKLGIEQRQSEAKEPPHA